MNKPKQFSAAVILLGILAGPAVADSNVTMFGFIDTGLMVANHVGDGTQSKTAMADSILGVSNLGFRGDEDLGGGVHAIFQLQAGFNPSKGAQSATGQLFSRNSYVGLSSGLGTLTVGKQWNFNDDWLVGSVFKGGYNSGAVFKFSEFDAVSEIYNNTIKYVTPLRSGLQGGIMMGLGEQAGSRSAGSVINVGLRYTQGNFYIAATHDREKDATATASPGNVYKLSVIGASYLIGPVKTRLGYAHSDIGGAGRFQSIPNISARTANAVELGVDYEATSAFTASADIVYRKSTTLSNSTAVYRLLGVYGLSKRTSLLANIAYLNNGGGASETLINTSSAAVGGGFANQTQSAIAVGIRHLF